MPVHTVTKEVFVEWNDEFRDWIDVEVDFDADEIMDIADSLGMVVFASKDDFEEQAEEYLDVYDILEEKLEQAMSSPYEKGKILDILKKVGLI